MPEKKESEVSRISEIDRGDPEARQGLPSSLEEVVRLLGEALREMTVDTETELSRKITEARALLKEMGERPECPVGV